MHMPALSRTSGGCRVQPIVAKLCFLVPPGVVPKRLILSRVLCILIRVLFALFKFSYNHIGDLDRMTSELKKKVHESSLVDHNA